MTLTEQAKEALFHPVAQLSVLISLISGWSIGLFDPAFGLVSATSGYWFPMLTAVSSFVLPETGYAQYATPVLVGVAIVYAAVQLERLIDRAREYLNNR